MKSPPQAPAKLPRAALFETVSFPPKRAVAAPPVPQAVLFWKEQPLAVTAPPSRASSAPPSPQAVLLRKLHRVALSVLPAPAGERRGAGVSHTICDELPRGTFIA